VWAPEERQRGWTLLEALHCCVDRQAFAELFSAQRQARMAGPRRYSYRSEFVEGPEVRASNAQISARRALHNNADRAAARLERELWSFLFRGNLVGSGRRGSPLADPSNIPQSAWSTLRAANWNQSIVKEPGPDQTQIFDIRIFPVLNSPIVAQLLDGTPLVEVLDRYVLKDPQVDCLRRHAIAEGGKLASFGWGLGQQIWPLSYGNETSLANPIGALIVNSDANRASVRAADWVMGKRFRRLMRLLAMGAIDAIGVPSKGGMPTPIPRSMWIRQPGELDLANGDLGEFVDSGSVRLKFKPFFSGIILRAPTPEASTTESVTPRREKPPKSSIRVKSKIEAERECEAWLASEMAKSPTFRPKPKREWFNEMQRRWPGKISRMRFNIIWSNCIRATGAEPWSHSGAPKRSGSNNQSAK
jgi:hypothetical protein